MAKGHRRPVWAEVDVDALRRNTQAIAAVAAPAQLCAVVKADGYGHGAQVAASAFLAGGADCLAVALVEEGIELRRAGIEAPILLLSEPAAGGMDGAVVHGLTPTVYSEDGLNSLVRAARRLGNPRSQVPTHVKVDTGMHRVGAGPDQALVLTAKVAESPELQLAGIWTHLAVADDPDNAYTAGQLRLFEKFLGTAHAPGGTAHAPGVTVHAANSAATLAFPGARYSMVRCGLSLYGYAPVSTAPFLQPALSLKARVSFVKEIEADERLSYGLAYSAAERTTIATVPLGYADGVPRRFGTAGGHALVGGRRCPVAGNVTMDQLMIDCGPASPVATGDEVVFIGSQGDQEISGHEWAAWLGVIVYEVLCGIGPRVPRITVGE